MAANSLYQPLKVPFVGIKKCHLDRDLRTDDPRSLWCWKENQALGLGLDRQVQPSTQGWEPSN